MPPDPLAMGMDGSDGAGAKKRSISREGYPPPQPPAKCGNGPALSPLYAGRPATQSPVRGFESTRQARRRG